MVISTPFNLLKSLPYFTDLNPQAREELLNSIREQSYNKGQIIMLEGEPCPGFLILASGLVKLYRSSSEGREQIVDLMRPGSCFECSPLFDGGPNPVSAQTLEASKVYFIPIADFELVIDRHPEIIFCMVPVLTMRLRSLLDLVEDFSFRPVASRLAKLLLQLSEQDGKGSISSLPQALNQQQLSCVLGCSRQAVNSSLRKLVREGIVQIERRRITVLQREALQKII